MARKFGKKNHVKVDPFNYSLMMLGEPKIGKTRKKEIFDKIINEIMFYQGNTEVTIV